MKIGIITQPLTANYGGFLQNFALQNILKVLGHAPITIDYLPKKQWYFLISWVKNAMFYLLQKKYYFTRDAKRNKMFSKFALQNLTLTRTIHSYNQKLIRQYQLAAFIVGSDQVWRPKYNGRALYDMFLRFASASDVIKIAYAASFGTEQCEFTVNQQEECKQLVKKFKAVSVREKSGIGLCNKLFNCSAIQVPDPTLLLHKSIYEDLCRTTYQSNPYIACYVLDSVTSVELENFRTINGEKLDIKVFSAANKAVLSIEEWLNCIRGCEYFITDSFHGCVFAIIFNKPFVCLGNEHRGNARFDTLLGTFGLEDRLVTTASADEICRVLKTPIDWERVNAIHDSERERGISFLKENLTSHD